MSSLEELFSCISTEMQEKNHKNLLFAGAFLKNYIADDWKIHLKYPEIGTYIKTLLYRDNNIEMFLIVWASKAKSCIHDHPDFGCIVKILYGYLEEQVYHKVCKCNTNPLCEDMTLCNSKMALKSEHNYLSINQIGYRENNMILHQISNTTDEIAVSLHIYSKPNYIHKSYESID